MSILATNKRAYFDYEILETMEAGVELLGNEVKSIKTGHISLAGAYAIIRGEEAWLINADIPPYQMANMPSGYDQKRTRKLLLHKKEIKYLLGKIQEKGLTLLPLKVYIKNQKVKCEIGIGKSRKRHDKREVLKRRASDREIAREISHR